jgi:hypothetical protein
VYKRLVDKLEPFPETLPVSEEQNGSRECDERQSSKEGTPPSPTKTDKEIRSVDREDEGDDATRKGSAGDA